jgi:hypothetical protein
VWQIIPDTIYYIYLLGIFLHGDIFYFGFIFKTGALRLQQMIAV